MKFKWLRSSSMFMFVMLLACIAIIATFERPSATKKTRSKNAHEPFLKADRDQKAKHNAKEDKPDRFMQMQREIRTREGDSGPRYKSNYKIEAMKKAGIIDINARTTSKTRLGKAASVAWVERGPANVAGRTRGLIVDPADGTHMTWFAGSVDGGIWKTTNGGDSWTDLTPDFANLATTVLTMAPSNDQIIYAGTGEGFFNTDAVDGNGIWKSTNKGTSWDQLASTVALNQVNQDFQNVNRIIVHPTNPDIVLAATNTGIFRSTNGGTNWTTTFSSPNVRILHLIANPYNFNTQYAGTGSGTVLKSTDQGLTWFQSSTGLSGNRVELAISPVDTNVLFASVDIGFGTGDDLFRSGDGGNSWTKMIINIPGGTTELNFLGGQGWYDNTIAAHPYNAGAVFVGGVDIFKVQLAAAGSTFGVNGIDYENTSSFLAFTGFTGGITTGIGYGADFFGGLSYALSPGDCTTVEIRFGPGKSQKAHRMNRAFATDNSYTYVDYSDVPFEVWDITGSRQLMVSYLDSSNNGFFNLSPWSGGFDSAVPREAIFVHAIPYNVSAPFDSIVNGHGGKEGQKYKNSYVITPALATGATWDPGTLPASTLRIRYGLKEAFTTTTTAITDGYDQYTGGSPQVHVDQHNIVIIPISSPSTFDMLVSNDGGVAFSTDGGSTWAKNQNTVRGYNTTQFYGVDKKPGELAFIGGTQDNGTWQSPVGTTDASVWDGQFGGDGFDAVWKYDNDSQLVGSQYGNLITKSTDGGTNWFYSYTGMEADVGIDNPKSYFITQIARSKLDPDLLFAISASGVWRSENFADSWTLIPLIPSNFGFSTGLNHVAISEANPQIVWAGTRMSSAGKVHVSTDGGLTFNPTVNYTTATLGALSGFATHPTEPSTAYAIFSIADAPKILRTTNLGQTWEDISGFGANSTSSNGFPDVATYCLQVNPNDTNELWAGTEIGLFISTDNGANWNYSNNGLPAVAIWEIKVVDDQVIVATHGRGVWTMQITAPILPTVTLAPRLNSAAQLPSTGNVVLNISLRSPYDSTLIKMNNATVAKLGATTVRDSLVSFLAPAPGAVTYKVVSYKGGTAYSSTSANVTIIQVSSAVTKYANNFNSATTDFSGSLFTRATPAGFTDGALHTPHPYADNTNNTYQLNIPISVTTDSCVLSFDEIALVEEGDPGTVFGDPNFWDYAIVEGTSDGINWIPIADGWDARLHSQWSTAYNSGTTPNSGYFKKHVLNILNKFSAGTTIFIRFRLFTDANTTGWGWAVDNVGVNADLVPPALTLGALASPVVNVVRFAVGANEKLSSASVFVNSNPLTMTKQGNLFFGNYTISGPGALSVFAEGTDSSNNPGAAISRSYTVSLLSKAAAFENFTLSSTQSEGYWILGNSQAVNAPAEWKLISAPIDVAATGSASNFKAEYTYSNIENLKVQNEEFDESKIGIYEYINGQWKYAGGEGKDGKVTAAFKGNQLAVFYNPDHKFVPTDFALSQNYPNPFNPSTTIQYDLPKESKVVIKVYNMLGQEVRTLVNATKGQGRYEAKWDGKNRFGNTVASGVYLYRLEAGKVVKSKKMLFIK